MLRKGRVERERELWQMKVGIIRTAKESEGWKRKECCGK
jgi:hypothetical protein